MHRLRRRRKPGLPLTGRRQEEVAAWLMVAPALLGLLFFVALPLLLCFGLSFTNLRMGSPHPTGWVGLDQYRSLLADPQMTQALLNNLTFAALVVPLQTGLALLVAILLNGPDLKLFRTLFFLPVVFPMSLVAVIWELLYGPGPGGPINAALTFLSAGHWQPCDFLHQRWLAWPALMLLSVWQGLGLQMVILLAALQGVPPGLYEAARLDGAGPWACFLHITLPQIRNSLIFTALMTTILSFRVFDQVQILTEGGPSGATTTLMYAVVVAAFERLQVGRASAITVIFFAIVVGVSVVQRGLARQEAA